VSGPAYGSLACFPMRLEWELATGRNVTETQPFPAPLRHSDMSVLTLDVPRPVTDLEMYAMSHGWTTRLTMSEGWEPHAIHGRPSASPKVKWAVRMQRGVERAVAVRTDGAWSSMWTWSTSQFFRRYGTLEAFKGAVR